VKKNSERVDNGDLDWRVLPLGGRRKRGEGFDQTALLANAAFVAAYRVGMRANLEHAT